MARSSPARSSNHSTSSATRRRRRGSNGSSSAAARPSKGSMIPPREPFSRPNILIVDNYDSFTWNLVHYLRELGAAVEVARNDGITVPQALASGADGFLISPGPGAPTDAGISLALVEACAAANQPLLGVCLGHQAIAQHFGADIGKAPRQMHGKTSTLAHDGSGLFEGIPSPFTAARYHSLAVRPEGF